jgi:iron complex outermembrane receptor protein
VPGGEALLLTGSEAFDSETVIAYEAGYRQQFRESVALDVAGYVNHYDDLRSQEFASGQPITLANRANAVSRGVETTVTAQLAPRWQLHASHAYLWKEFTFDPGSTDPTGGVAEANDPSNIIKVRSYINASSRLEIDSFFRYYTELPNPKVDAYGELDARIGYRIRRGWDLSLIGNNLLHPRHLEFRAGTAPETYERAVSLRSVWRF